MPEPAHSKTRATAAIAASVLTVTGVGAAHADGQVQNPGGPTSSTTVEPDNPPSTVNATPIENVATQNSPQVYVEQGVVINPARSQSITVSGEGFTGGGGDPDLGAVAASVGATSAFGGDADDAAALEGLRGGGGGVPEHDRPPVFSSQNGCKMLQ